MEQNMTKLLVIVDMQNDFVTGSLANPDAEKIVPGIVELIKNWNGNIAFTMDMHTSDYLNTQEGKRLPIKHCIIDTEGFQHVKDIRDALDAFDKSPETNLYSFCKETFGSYRLADHVEDFNYDEIYFCGTCTDICVISNAIMCKTFDPEARIIVLKDLCAGTTPENHENALKAMKQCQIDIE